MSIESMIIASHAPAAAGGSYNVGIETVGSTEPGFGLKTRYMGIPITTGAAGTLVSVTANLRDNGGNNAHKTIAMVYSTGGTLLGQSALSDAALATRGWVTLTGLAVAVSAATTYIVLLHSSQDSSNVYLIYTNTTAGSSRKVQTPTSLMAAGASSFSPDNPATIESESQEYSIYATINT